jgi:multisubunit Na+/H+ antiporter MnhF subunit
MNLPAAIALVSAIAGFAAAYRFLKGKPLRIRILALVILGALAIPTVLFSVYYLHILPEMAWFYTLRSWGGSEFLAVFLGCAGAALATLLPRFLLALPLFLAIGTTFLPFLKRIMNPPKLGETKENWEGDACFQSTASTCGPASAASILRTLGLSASEHEIALASHTSASGTEAWYLARHLRSRGVFTRFDFRPTFDPSVALPAVVGVRLIGGSGHFIAVLSVKGDTVTFVDPLRGKKELPLDAFRKAYSFTGFHLSVTKAAA